MSEDEIARRYGWQDYDHFKTTTITSSDTWCHRAIDDVIDLEKEVQELREFKEKATPILKDLWYWETCPKGFKLTIEEITGEKK